MSGSFQLVVAMTGATGSIFGIRLLQRAHDLGVETHLVMSKWGARTLLHETGMRASEVQSLATHHYSEGDQGAAISSGSFRVDAMAVVPCSMRTLAAIASGQADGLVARAADVTIKEGRKLVLATRESPLSAIHLENMLKLARLGITILPPVPAFYNHPTTLEEMVDHVVIRILDQIGLRAKGARRWDGHMRP